VVGRLEVGDKVVRDPDGSDVFGRMLLTRGDGAADPGQIDERRQPVRLKLTRVINLRLRRRIGTAY